MLRRTAIRIAIASTSALIAGGAVAAPASAQVGPVILPHQYFYGQVISTTTSTGADVIQVDCAGAAADGYPAPGQFVNVQLLATPPVNTTTGYTGNYGNEIDADLIWSQGTVTVVTPIATFFGYNMPQGISTSATVPCSGTGVMSFSPSPDPDNSGIPSDVDVTFVSIGVASGGDRPE